MSNITLNIDHNILNIFTSNNLDSTIASLNLTNYYYLDQIHSDIIHIVDNNYQNNSRGDGLITNKPNTPLVIKTADCIPVLIYDKKNKIIGAIHSGWRSTLNLITNKAIDIFINKYHSKKENLSVYLYPSIRQCHFEVEENVYNLFKQKITNIDNYTISKNNKYYLNLQQIIKDNLNKIGITNIIDTNICTYCHHHKYHSYRYNHTDKRNYLLVMIKE